jgi:hypothetical protein
MFRPDNVKSSACFLLLGSGSRHRFSQGLQLGREFICNGGALRLSEILSDA